VRNSRHPYLHLGLNSCRHPYNLGRGTRLNLNPDVLVMNMPEVEKHILRFISDYVEKTGTKGIVLGLSGGIDSCTTAALSAKAIGGNRVLGLLLFEEETRTSQDIKHAKLVARKFKIQTETIDITDPLKALYRSIPAFDPRDKLSKGNLKARTRMIYNYYYANRLGRLVCGSSDKSESMMGYFTKWGDIAADISPIMDLYKTQVRRLARHMGIPQAIVDKPSSPALWPNQLAEDELGIPYTQLDLILYGLERFMKPEEIRAQLGIEEHVINKIKQRWLSAEHKRRMLLTAKLEYRTIGTDFRLPRDPY
jgi:NAD+ synthase